MSISIFNVCIQWYISTKKMYNSYQNKFQWKKWYAFRKNVTPLCVGWRKKLAPDQKSQMWFLLRCACMIDEKRYILLIARFIQTTLLFLEPDPEVGHTRLHRFWRQFSKVCLQIFTVLCIVYASCWSRAEKIRAFMASDRSWFFGITPLKSFRLQGFRKWYDRRFKQLLIEFFRQFF